MQMCVVGMVERERGGCVDMCRAMPNHAMPRHAMSVFHTLAGFFSTLLLLQPPCAFYTYVSG